MVDAPASVFGFHVRSPYRLRLLRTGPAAEPLDILPMAQPLSVPAGPPVCEWVLRTERPEARARLYAVDGGFHFSTAAGTAFHIDPRRRSIQVASRGDDVLWEAGLWGIPALLCFQERGDFPLHAAAAEVGGAAVLLAAPGGSGKTTLALAFHRLGFRVLCEDLACCQLAQGPVLLPGPAMLRLRPDVLGDHAPAGTHLLGTRNERVYLALDAQRRGNGDPVPIRALVLLEASSDGVRLERLAGARSLSHLWALTFRLPGDQGTRPSFRRLAQLAGTVPIWQLHRPLRQSCLDETVARIVESCASGEGR